jgi:uncharacterized Ntn-hydrolase superfamily protein
VNISTFSLVARDPDTGHLAVAGTSNGFAYGSIVPHIEAGVGAIATQAAVNLNYAAEGMLELRERRSAPDTMVHLLKDDPDPNGKYQLIILDNEGNTACHTGQSTYDYKGHISKKNLALAGNTLVGEETLNAIVSSFESSDSPFALRVIKALQAGHEAGGDIRGSKSAAIKIVRGERTDKFWEGVLLDLRTDDNENPLVKLENLYILSEANRYVNKGWDTSSAPVKALEYFLKALELDPENPEYMLWAAKTYKTLGNDAEAELLLAVVKNYPGHWMEYWERLEKNA